MNAALLRGGDALGAQDSSCINLRASVGSDSIKDASAKKGSWPEPSMAPCYITLMQHECCAPARWRCARSAGFILHQPQSVRWLRFHKGRFGKKRFLARTFDGPLAILP